MRRNLEVFVLGGITSVLLLWVLTDILQVGNVFLKIAWFLLPFFAWHLIIKDKTERSTENIFLLHTIMVLIVLIWLFPVFINHGVPLGKDFTKPFHDGMAVDIARHGIPSDNPEKIDILEYPNAMHTLGGFFAQLGFPLLHANLAAIIFAMTINSYAAFLLLEYIYKDEKIAAIFAGTSSLVSFAIPYYTYLSPPQAFTFFLIIPSIYLFKRSIDDWRYGVGFALALSLITASYSGLSLLLLFLFVLSFASFFIYFKKGLKKAIITAIITVLLISLVLAAQSNIYWDNLSGERNDCYDSSHYAFPIVPLLFFSLFCVSSFLFIKQKRYKSLLGITIVIFTLMLLSPIVYELIFQSIHPYSSYEDCLEVDDDGMFGGWTHLRVHRVAFMQNFIFLLFLPALPFAFKKRRIMVALLMIIALLFIGFNPVYETEPTDGRYELNDIKNGPVEMTAPLFIYRSASWIEKGWSPELVDTLDEIYPSLSDKSRLVFVSYDKKQSFSHRWFIYLYLDKHYKYVLRPREFFAKYVFSYDYIISYPCRTEKIPRSYKMIREEEDFCVLRSAQASS
ncbi:MAG: hypothetical protein ACE5DM_02260 [Candidatus Nanoarchaeia archaeon]